MAQGSCGIPLSMTRILARPWIPMTERGCSFNPIAKRNGGAASRLRVYIPALGDPGIYGNTSSAENQVGASPGLKHRLPLNFNTKKGVLPMSIRLEAGGDYALFYRPEMEVEWVSYDTMTPSPAQGAGGGSDPSMLAHPL